MPTPTTDSVTFVALVMELGLAGGRIVQLPG